MSLHQKTWTVNRQKYWMNTFTDAQKKLWYCVKNITSILKDTTDKLPEILVNAQETCMWKDFQKTTDIDFCLHPETLFVNEWGFLRLCTHSRFQPEADLLLQRIHVGPEELQKTMRLCEDEKTFLMQIVDTLQGKLEHDQQCITLFTEAIPDSTLEDKILFLQNMCEPQLQAKKHIATLSKTLKKQRKTIERQKLKIKKWKSKITVMPVTYQKQQHFFIFKGHCPTGPFEYQYIFIRAQNHNIARSLSRVDLNEFTEEYHAQFHPNGVNTGNAIKEYLKLKNIPCQVVCNRVFTDCANMAEIAKTVQRRNIH